MVTTNSTFKKAYENVIALVLSSVPCRNGLARKIAKIYPVNRNKKQIRHWNALNIDYILLINALMLYL